MTQIEFKNTLDVIGGQFVFSTSTLEGMIGVSPYNIVIWVDELGFSEKTSESDEPRNSGKFKTIGELLEMFSVDGKSFATSVLPAIEKINRIST